MPLFNGMQMSVEAHRIATKIRGYVGKDKLDESDSIADQLRTDLRRLYSATGGKRGNVKIDGKCYNPTSYELRQVYNGEATGAEIHARNRPGSGPVATESTPSADVSADEPNPVVGEGPDEKAITALKMLLGSQKIDPEAVKKIAKDTVDARVSEVLASMSAIVASEIEHHVQRIEIKLPSMPEISVETAHHMLPEIMRFVVARQHVMLKGPAGCGKTHIAKQIADILGLDYGFSGKCIDEVKLLGYMDAGGTYRSTTFRKIWEFGGVFLADEMDAWAPEALIALNAPLSGDFADFPDAIVPKHPDFVMLGAVNTNGTGADRKYSAREVLDFASRNRFAFLEMDYDEALELAISCDAEWTKYVQKVRAAIRTVGGVDTDVTPRDSIGGGIMLASGTPRHIVEEAYIWRGMEQDTKNRILAAVR